MVMYLIRGYTNYECTEGPELEYGEFSELSEALQAGKTIASQLAIIRQGMMLPGWMRQKVYQQY